MASFSVPCPKIPALFAAPSSASDYCPGAVSFPRSDIRSKHGSLQGCYRNHSEVFKVYAKVSAEKLPVSNQVSEPVSVEKSENQPNVPDISTISAFMTQVSDLIEQVDSRDIVELQLKQMGCQLLLRKKEALQRLAVEAPVTFSPFPQQTMLPPQLPPNGTSNSYVGSVPPTAASPPAPPTPTKPKSSHPPFKCPMAGNFYRSPAPSAPPFVKVGDKIQKGQVICIIEAMKLMNEIEAEKSGTVVDILVEDGKPVSVDMPLFIIEP